LKESKKRWVYGRIWRAERVGEMIYIIISKTKEMAQRFRALDAFN
jgi:hypothetical protein